LYAVEVVGPEQEDPVRYSGFPLTHIFKASERTTPIW